MKDTKASTGVESFKNEKPIEAIIFSDNTCPKCGRQLELVVKQLANIPIALERIREDYPDTVLGIYNKIDNNDIECYIGWEHVKLLNKGSYDEILDRLLKLRQEILEKKGGKDERKKSI